jgi:exosome complex component CSL4
MATTTTTPTTTLAIPGQLLGPASKYRPGPGVHLHESNLYSSLLGDVTITQPASQSSSSSTNPPKRISRITQNLPSRAGAGGAGAARPSELPTISVSRGIAAAGAGGGIHQKQREVLPQVGNTVLCRVTRITPRQAVVAILVCGDTVLNAEWQGVIRVQDVRATEKDRVKVYESFRPGDIVRASVVSGCFPPWAPQESSARFFGV